MRLGIALMALGVALMLYGLLVISMGVACPFGACHPGPSINEISFWMGAGMFAAGWARCAYAAGRSRRFASITFVALSAVVFAMAIVALFGL